MDEEGETTGEGLGARGKAGSLGAREGARGDNGPVNGVESQTVLKFISFMQ